MARSASQTDGTVAHQTNVDTSEDVGVRLARAVAAARDDDPVASDVTLYEYIDADALERLYRHTGEGADWEFSFTVDDLEVTFDSDGQIEIS